MNYKNDLLDLIKDISTVIFVIFLDLALLIGINENKRKDDVRYEATVKAFEQTQEVLIYQQKLIEQYKRDCENITSKVINGEW